MISTRQSDFLAEIKIDFEYVCSKLICSIWRVECRNFHSNSSNFQLTRALVHETLDRRIENARSQLGKCVCVLGFGTILRENDRIRFHEQEIFHLPGKKTV